MNHTKSLIDAAGCFMAHRLALVESEDIGDSTRIWAFAHVMEGARIGRNCNVGEHCFIERGVTIGDNVTVKNGVCVWSGVTLEDNVFVGPNSVFTNDPNPRAYIKKSEDALVSTLIRANATVGANATIVCGITVGRYAFIGAGAVVIRNVLDFGLVVGNPARQIGWMCRCAKRISSVNANGSITCPNCGRQYHRNERALVPNLDEV